MTGLYPNRHGAGLVRGEPKMLTRDNLPSVLGPEVPTLPDLLSKRGYETAAFLGVWNAALPLPKRFDHSVVKEEPGRKLVRRAVKWIRGRDRPFFCWIHLGDAHDPLAVDGSIKMELGASLANRARRWAYTKREDDTSTDAFRTYRDARVRLYDAAVASSDAAIAQLWEGIGTRRDQTLLVVTSDHGEELWEHRDEEIESFEDPRAIFGVGHGHNLFQVHLLVPLLFHGLGIAPGAVDANASLADVMPTVLGSLEGEAAESDGVSLLDRIDPGRPVVAEGIAYGNEKKSVVAANSKLLSSPRDGYERAFRLGSSRLEESVEDESVAGRLRALIPGGAGTMGEQAESSPEILEHLRGLGYIE